MHLEAPELSFRRAARSRTGMSQREALTPGLDKRPAT